MNKVAGLMSILMCTGTVFSATMMPGYTIGSGSQLHIDNGGSGSVLFVDSGATGGNDLTDTDGTNVSFTALIDGAGKWRIGDTVEITGFALPVHAITTNGTMTFDILQGSGGIGASGAGGLASLGTRTGTYNNSGSTSTMYVNFDTSVSFVVDTNTFKVGVNIANSGQLRIKAQWGYPVPRYNRNTGDLWSDLRVSLAGNVTPVAVTSNTAPEFSEDPIEKALAYTDALYSETLADVVSDPDNDAVSLSVVSFNGPGSDWLGLDGMSVTGTPTTADIGANEWVIQAVDIHGGTNTATLTIQVLPGTGSMIGGYTVGSGLLTPNGETLFVDTAGTGGTDQSDTDGTNGVFTVLIPGAGFWEIGDTVEITGFALQIQGYTDAGIMTFDVRQAVGGIGPSGAGGLPSLGTATGTYLKTGVNETMYVNFETPVTFVADANSTNIGINISNSARIRLKHASSFPVVRYNYINGNFNSYMKVSVAGVVNREPELGPYDQWESEYGVTNGPSGDDDNDGLINLYEYGLGGNPTNGHYDDAYIPVFGQGTGGLGYVHAQLKDDTNLVYYLNLTPNLVSPTWTNNGYTVVGTNVMDVGDFDFVTNLIDTGASAKFIKLEIEQAQ